MKIAYFISKVFHYLIQMLNSLPEPNFYCFDHQKLSLCKLLSCPSNVQGLTRFTSVSDPVRYLRRLFIYFFL